jgi:hypothetical protein
MRVLRFIWALGNNARFRTLFTFTISVPLQVSYDSQGSEIIGHQETLLPPAYGKVC